jgi:predicted secreted acid phosphatase
VNWFLRSTDLIKWLGSWIEMTKVTNGRKNGFGEAGTASNFARKPEPWRIVMYPSNAVPRSALALLLLLMTAVVAHASNPDCLPNASLPPPEIGQPRNLADLKAELVYYKCSGAYDRDFKAVIDQAIAYVVDRAKNDAENGKHLAIVLDIDETSLSNWKEIRANDFALIGDGPCDMQKLGDERHEACGFKAWILAAAADPLADTLRLFKIAQANHVAVFFVTGRKETDQHEVQSATEKNLSKAGYSNWTRLMLEPVGYAFTVQQFKTEKRREIMAMGFTIIANVGDQYSDLRSDPRVGNADAEQNYKVPNPFYFAN